MEDMIKIAESFGIKPSCVYKTKYYYTVKCGKNEYRIIPSALSEDKLRELYNIEKILFNSGLKVCDKLVIAPEGKIAVEGDEGKYIMTEAVKGHNLEFENSTDLRSTFTTLGAMHSILKNIDVQKENIDISLDIMLSYKKGLTRLKSIKKQLGCAKRITDMDIDFIRHYGDFYDLAQSAVSTLEGMCFSAVCPIHGAIKEDNIFVGRNVVLTDWELFRPGHFMEDTAQLITRYVRKYASNAKDYLTLDEILYSYTIENPVTDKELAVLYALLMYPKRYISISTKYYGKAHKFTPAGTKRKFDEVYEQKNFYLSYIGI